MEIERVYFASKIATLSYSHSLKPTYHTTQVLCCRLKPRTWMVWRVDLENES